MTNDNERRIALERIKALAAPGQELGISDAINLIYNIYNVARAALVADVEGPSGPN